MSEIQHALHLPWEALLRHASDLIPALQPHRLAKVTAAPRPIPSDGLPVMGPLGSGLHLAVTHSAVTLAPVVAKIVADGVRRELGLKTRACHQGAPPPWLGL